LSGTLRGKREVPIKMHDSDRKAGQASPWFILAVVLVASMAGTVNYYKVPPLMPLLMAAYRLSGAEAGFLMSIFALVGVGLSIPAGVILNTLGYRMAGIIGVAWITAGAALGAVSTGFMSLLATRLMEGIGLNLMAIVAPTVIAAYFRKEKQSTAVGIWSVWYPLGSTITFTVSPLIASQWGWRSVWWFGCFYAAAAGILYSILVKPLPSRGSESFREGMPQGREMPGSRQTFLNRDLWKLSLMFLAFAFAYVAFLTWTPTFLHTARGVPLSHAAWVMSLFSVLALGAAPASGWVLGRVASPGAICAVVMALFCAPAAAICFVPLSYVLPLLVIMGMIGSFLPAAIVSMAARLIHEGKVSALAVSMVTVGQNAGIFLGPILFGLAMESAGGWTLAYATYVPICLLGIVAALLLKGRSLQAVAANK
jgi:predicted MFS family arabinose efflux permease